MYVHLMKCVSVLAVITLFAKIIGDDHAGPAKRGWYGQVGTCVWLPVM